MGTSLRESLDEAVSSYHSVREEYMNARKQALAAETGAVQIKSEIHTLQQQIEIATLEHEKANRKHSQSTKKGDDDDDDGNDAQLEAEARAEREFQLGQLENHLEVLEQSLKETQQRGKEQHAVAKSFEQDLDTAEKVKDDLEFKNHKFAAQENVRREELEKDHQRRLQHVASNEAKIAQRIQKMEEHKFESVTEAVSKESHQIAKGLRNLSAAQHGSSRAAGRIRVAKKEQRKAREAFENERKQVVKKRAKAILELKNNIEQVVNDVQGENEKKERARRLRAQQEAAEFKSLLDDRKNPYEVFRRRRLEAKLAGEKKELELKIEKSKMRMVKGIIEFDEYALKKEEEERRAKMYENQYRDSLGRHLQEQKTREYIKAITTEGTESIDPSGRGFRLQPSEFTDLKLHSFGLGKRPCDPIIDKLRAKPAMRHVRADQMLVLRGRDPQPPGQGSRLGAASASSAGGGLSAPSTVPGKEFGGGEMATQGSDEEEYELGELTEDQGLSANKFWPELSVLEQRVLENARARHKEGIVKDQVVWGKVFKGVAFLAKPAVLVFKDFELETTYTLRFTLSNVSYTFNMFKALELPKRVQNYFELKYRKPGRMSAGTSCTLTLEFTPKVDQDIEFDLPFLAQTGPFHVPVRCLRKRASPTLSTGLVRFGHVVLGESESKTLRISNNGALEVRYQIIPKERIADIDRELAARAARRREESVETVTEEEPVNPYSWLFGPETEDDSPRDSKGAEVGSSRETNNSFGKTKEINNSFGKTKEINNSFGKTKEINNSFGKTKEINNSFGKTKEINNSFGKTKEINNASGDSMETNNAPQTQTHEETGILKFPTRGTIPKYSFRILPFDLSPAPDTPVGPIQRDYMVVFDDPETAPVALQVRGFVTDTPIYVANADIDLHCCVVGKQYRSRIVFCNRGNVALLVDLSKATDARAVQFNPSFGFVQARDRASGQDGVLEVQVKFSPDQDLLARLGPPRPIPAPARGPAATGPLHDFAVPLEVLVHGQTLPIQCGLSGTLTRGEVDFSVPPGGTIHLGSCFTNQTVAVPLRLTNRSALPQKFGFVKLRPQLAVRPHDGFGLLLPFESKTVEVLFSPGASKEQVLPLECRTGMNQTYRWQCLGRGVEPQLELSSSEVRFGAAAVGNVLTQSVTLRNNGAKRPANGKRAAQNAGDDSVPPGSRYFEFVVPAPHRSHLKITPQVGLLRPGQSTRIQVEFRAMKGQTPNEQVGANLLQDVNPQAASQDEPNEQDEPTAQLIDENKRQAVATLEGNTGKGDVPTLEETSGKLGDAPSTEGSTGKGDAPAVTALDEPESAQPALPTADESARGPAPTGHPLGSVVSGQADEPWSLHSNWTIPCYIRAGESMGDPSLGGKASGSKASLPSASSDSLQGAPPLLFLGVKTVTVSTELWVDRDRVDFGDVAVGHAKAITIKLRNLGDTASELRCDGLNPLGTFSILNSLRRIQPKGNHTVSLTLQFSPQFNKTSVEELVLRTDTGMVQVRLRGKGVCPRIAVEGLPPDDCLRFDPILLGERSRKDFTVRNASQFPVNFWIEQDQRERVPPSFSGKAVFSFRPAEAWVAPGAAVTVTAHYEADRALPGGLPHASSYIVRTPNASSDFRFSAVGTCWPDQLFVCLRAACMPPRSPSATALPDVPAVSDPARGLLAQDWVPPGEVLSLPGAHGPTAGVFQPAERRVLEFRKGAMTRYLSVGCLTGQRALAAGGSFELSVAPASAVALFTLSTSRGALKPGGGEKVTVTFAPGGDDARVEGEWTEATLTCELKGGYVADSDAEGKVVKFHLRGMM